MAFLRLFFITDTLSGPSRPDIPQSILLVTTITFVLTMLFYTDRSGSIPQSGDKSGRDPYLHLYKPDALLWTSFAAGVRTRAPVGVPSNFEKIWSGTGMFYEIEIGSHGFRGNPPGPPGNGLGNSIRLLVIGDSAVFGFFTDENYTFCHLTSMISRILPDCSDISVMNYGVPGYSSAQGRRLLPLLLESTLPDVVAFCFGTNDARDTATRFPASLKHMDDEELLNRLEMLRVNAAMTETGSSADGDLCGLLEQEFGSDDHGDAGGQLHSVSGKARVSVRDFRKNMKEMVVLTRDAGARPVIIINALQPEYKDVVNGIMQQEKVRKVTCDSMFYSANGAMRSRKVFPLFTEQLESVLSEKKLSENPWLHSRIDGSHPNRAGHYLIALELARIVADADISTFGEEEGLSEAYDMEISGLNGDGLEILTAVYPEQIAVLVEQLSLPAGSDQHFEHLRKAFNLAITDILPNRDDILVLAGRLRDYGRSAMAGQLFNLPDEGIEMDPEIILSCLTINPAPSGCNEPFYSYPDTPFFQLQNITGKGLFRPSKKILESLANRGDSRYSLVAGFYFRNPETDIQ